MGGFPSLVGEQPENLHFHHHSSHPSMKDNLSCQSDWIWSHPRGKTLGTHVGEFLDQGV